MLTVIIPTLNAGRGLGRTLSSLMPGVMSGLIEQLVVTDGGSDDRTLDVAREAGADIVTGPPGRGTQLAAGGAKAHNDWLLFLHADTRLESGWQLEIQQFMDEAEQENDMERVGYFRFRLNDRRAAARRLERIVSARCRLFALPYGDQGLLISRRFYERIGGFRDIPLMEDVEFVRRIGRGHLQCLGHAAVTSASRYRREGYLRRSLRNAGCLAMWFCGVSPERIARFYK